MGSGKGAFIIDNCSWIWTKCDRQGGSQQGPFRSKSSVPLLKKVQQTFIYPTFSSQSPCDLTPCTLGLVRIPHRLILPLTWYRAPAHCHSQGTLGFFCELMSSLSSVNHLVLQKSSIACWLIQDSRCRAWTGILVSCPFSHHLHSQNPVGISQFYFIFLKKKFNHGFLLPLIK